MATKFTSLENSKPRKQTRFTKRLNRDLTIQKVSIEGSDYENVLYIGYDTGYGHAFKAWDNGVENSYGIFFGEKGDEFN